MERRNPGAVEDLDRSPVPPAPPSLAKSGDHGPVEVRASDAERQVVARALSRHFADGRLSETEFDERLGRSLESKTTAELASLLVDLPALTPDTSATPSRREFRLWGVALLVSIGLAVVVVTGLAFGFV